MIENSVFGNTSLTFVSYHDPIELIFFDENWKYDMPTLALFYIYDAENLTNLLGTYWYGVPYNISGSLQLFFSSSNALTVFCPSCDGYTVVQLMFRIRHLHTANCFNETSLGYAIPVFNNDPHSTVVHEITALSSGSCMYSVVVPYANNSQYGLVPIFNLISINYTGNSTVEVTNSEYGVRLFSITAENSRYWLGGFIYGPLITFNIPPGETIR